MKRMTRTVFLISMVVTSAMAGELSRDKSEFHLFHPVPAGLLREMSTDRPDTTESPFTVDAGHLQIELDAAAFTRDRHTAERDGGEESWAFLNTNIKLGLTNWMDLQIVTSVFNRIQGGAEGFGDITVRIKMNLWGNDEGGTALAVMPWVKFPTAGDGLGNDQIEGGLIVPFAAELGGEWSFGAMLEVDAIADEEEGGHHAEFVTTATVGHPIIGSLSGYLEWVSILSTENGAGWVASANAGLTYKLNDNVQLDAGIRVGLTREAEDLSPFVGLSIRF